MLSDNIFRITLIISLSLHILAFSPWPGLNLMSKDKLIEPDIEVYYIMPEKFEEKMLENIPQEYDLKKKELAINKRDFEEKAHTQANAVEEAQSLSEEISENLEEYIQYYELIRERIKKVASNKYKSRKSGGEVSLVFILNPKGILKDVSCIQDKSSSDKYLIDIALKSIKDASPFPVFPDALKKDSLSFNLTVVFKN